MIIFEEKGVCIMTKINIIFFHKLDEYFLNRLFFSEKSGVFQKNCENLFLRITIILEMKGCIIDRIKK